MVDLSMRVLVVDDMPAMRTIVRDMLERIGFKDISEAEDGDSAWQLARQEASSGRGFGLIVSDRNMPGMNGIDLLRTLRSFALTRDVPFLMITGEGDLDHLAEAVNAGATDYVVKPFRAEQLSEKIQGFFDVSR